MMKEIPTIPTPSNVIIKSVYDKTKQLLRPRYFDAIIDQIIQYIKENPQHYDVLEIEAKLGKFEFKGDHVNVLEKINEIFIIPDNIKTSNPNSKFFFNAGISARDFYLIWSALEKESKLKPPLNGPKIEFIKPQSYKDILYSTNKRHSSIFLDGHKIKEEIIRKEKKKNINVRNGGFDFRITCSEEIETEIDEEKDIIESERDKFRVSYQLSYYRVDLTISKDSKKNNELAYEIEIELNKLNTELVGKEKIDEKRIRTILDRFLQNIMNLYSVLYPEILCKNSRDVELSCPNHLNKEEIQSKFGNYFKSNLRKNK